MSNHDSKPLFRRPQIKEGLTIYVVFESEGRRYVNKIKAQINTNIMNCYGLFI